MRIRLLTRDLDVSQFTCGDEPHHRDLDEFLKADARRYMATSMSQTFVGIERGELVGYITLLMDAIWLNSDEKSLFEQVDIPPAQTIPALKVGRLARSATCTTRGVGTALMRFALDKLVDLSEQAGGRLLSVDAIPSAVEFYERLGFVPNLHNNHTGKRRGTVSMRFDAFAPTLPDWAI